MTTTQHLSVDQVAHDAAQLAQDAAHAVARTAGSIGAAGHSLSALARHEADVVVDAVLAPLSLDLEEFDVDLTEDDLD